jgi:hypothetical protein
MKYAKSINFFLCEVSIINLDEPSTFCLNMRTELWKNGPLIHTVAHLFRNETEEDSNVAHISVFCFSHFDGYVFIRNPAPIVSIKNASKNNIR